MTTPPQPSARATGRRRWWEGMSPVLFLPLAGSCGAWVVALAVSALLALRNRKAPPR